MKCFYIGRDLDSRHVSHAAAERDNHKYIARVQTPTGYRYFYDESELVAYYNGQEQNTNANANNQKAFEPTDITKHFKNDGRQVAIDNPGFESGINRAHDAAVSANTAIREAPGKVSNAAQKAVNSARNSALNSINSAAEAAEARRREQIKNSSKAAKERQREEIHKRREFNNKVNAAQNAASNTAKKVKDATYYNNGEQYAIDPRALKSASNAAQKAANSARAGLNSALGAINKAAKKVKDATVYEGNEQYAIDPKALKNAEKASRSANQKAQEAVRSGGNSALGAINKAAKAVGSAVYKNDGSQTAFGALKESKKSTSDRRKSIEQSYINSFMAKGATAAQAKKWAKEAAANYMKRNR